MTRRRHAAAVALGFFATFLGTSDADAFCRSTTCTDTSDAFCARDFEDCKVEGNSLYWDTRCVSFSLQKDASEFISLSVVEDVTAASVVEWSERECPGGGNAALAFSQDDDVECRKAEYNQGGANANIVLFQDYKWDYASIDNTLAKTTVTFDKDTGEILDADMEINHAYNEYSVDDVDVVYDLQSIMTHEFGHFIGMDHTLDGSATMNAGYNEGSIELRTLEDDDIGGLCAAYPPSSEAKCITAPKGGFASECGGTPAEDEGCSIAQVSPAPTNNAIWLALMGAAGLGWRRRQRRGAYRNR